MKKHFQNLLTGVMTALPAVAFAQEEGGGGGLNAESIINSLNEHVAPWGIKILGAIVGYFIASMVAKSAGRFATKTAMKRGIDEMVSKFLGSLVKNLILIASIVAILGIFGIETSSFAAIIGAAGLAVGLAFEGTLGNFAAGIMLLVFRPFKVGDLINAAGVTGIVEEVALFVTTLKTLDNQMIIVPNKKLTDDVMTNVGALDTRRVDIDVGCDYDTPIDDCRAALEEALKDIPKMLQDPAPQIFLSSLGGSSVDWQVRVWCNTPDYWDVWQATIRSVHKTLGEKGIGIPYPQTDIHLDASVIEALKK